MEKMSANSDDEQQEQEQVTTQYQNESIQYQNESERLKGIADLVGLKVKPKKQQSCFGWVRIFLP